jgi:predicted Zn-dependent protease with MMP-like domain
MEMHIDEFEKIVEEVLESVPQKFKDKFENIEFLIDEESASPFLSKHTTRPHYTLGLYHGVPMTRKTHRGQRFPDRIIIYKKSIEAVSRDRERLEKNIKRVVLHEIGHYFGISEKRLRDLGY